MHRGVLVDGLENHGVGATGLRCRLHPNTSEALPQTDEAWVDQELGHCHCPARPGNPVSTICGY